MNKILVGIGWEGILFPRFCGQVDSNDFIAANLAGDPSLRRNGCDPRWRNLFLANVLTDAMLDSNELKP
jgi:hypothetical protein